MGMEKYEYLGEEHSLQFNINESVDIVAGVIRHRVDELRDPTAAFEIDGRMVFMYAAQIVHTGPTRASRPIIYPAGAFPPPVNESMRIHIYGKHVETPNASGGPNWISFDLVPIKQAGPDRLAETRVKTWYRHQGVIPYFNRLLLYLGNLYFDSELVDSDGRLTGERLIHLMGGSNLLPLRAPMSGMKRWVTEELTN
jgi:hypothetical protein